MTEASFEAHTEPVELTEDIEAIQRLRVALEQATPERRAAVLLELESLEREFGPTQVGGRRRPRLSDAQDAARARFRDEYALVEEQLLPPTGPTVQSSPRFKPSTMEVIEAWARSLGLGSKTNTQRVLVLAMLVRLGAPPDHGQAWDPTTLG